jgi:hypothetical protein
MRQNAGRISNLRRIESRIARLAASTMRYAKTRSPGAGLRKNGRDIQV